MACAPVLEKSPTQTHTVTHTHSYTHTQERKENAIAMACALVIGKSQMHKYTNTFIVHFFFFPLLVNAIANGMSCVECARGRAIANGMWDTDSV